MAAAAQAAIIIECVPEILELKKSVFEQLGRHCPPEAIYVTNTSSLVPSQLAGSCPHSERMAALHFHLPVALSNVVDLMPHPGTDLTVVAALDAFAREIGQIPIHYKQEYHGYIFNSIFGAMQQQALDLVIEGVTGAVAPTPRTAMRCPRRSGNSRIPGWCKVGRGFGSSRAWWCSWFRRAQARKGTQTPHLGRHTGPTGC
jgi:hypothetical protein